MLEWLMAQEPSAAGNERRSVVSFHSGSEEASHFSESL
jgi:hypothetical protein